VAAADGSGTNALHAAAGTGRSRCLALLLDSAAGAALLHARCAAGLTPLHYACRAAHPGCVELLLSRGAQVSGRANPFGHVQSASP
jgi:ankyrin repeat protein